MSIDKKDIRCPTCSKPNTWTADNSAKPFCSERCKLIDLGEWASEKHSIPGEESPVDDEDDSNNVA